MRACSAVSLGLGPTVLRCGGDGGWWLGSGPVVVGAGVGQEGGEGAG